jgi:hypothetical protein
MATKAGFKQQCPSCEAMVPVKDTSFVGKKIDCPKCKYRFVVEDPDVAKDNEAVDEPKPVKALKKGKDTNGVTARKPVNARPAPVNGKKGKIRPDDDDEPPAPAKKKSGASTTLIVGIGLGVVAVIGLVIAGLVIAGVFDSDPPKKSTGGSTETAQKDDGDKKADKPQVAEFKGSDITNLLPNDTDEVMRINLSKAMPGSIGKLAFGPGSPGTFSRSAFENRFGFKIEAIETDIQAINKKQHWHFNVLRMTKDLDMEELKTNLGLRKEEAFTDMEVFTITAEMDSFSKFLFQIEPKNRKDMPPPLLLTMPDKRTLVIAHLAPMKKFVEDKGAPKPLSKAPEQAAEGGNQGGGAQRGGPGMQGGGPGMGGGAPAPGGPGMQGGGPGMGGGAPAPGGPGMQGGGPGMGGGTPAPGGPGMMGGMGMRGGMPGGYGMQGGGTQTVSSGHYLTIRPDLKGALDMTEEGKDPVLMSMAYDTEVLRESGELEGKELVASIFSAVSITFRAIDPSRLVVRIGYHVKDDDVAKKMGDAGRLGLAAGLAIYLKETFGIDASIDQQQGQGWGPQGGFGGQQGGPMPGFGGMQGGSGPGMRGGSGPGVGGQQGGPQPGFGGMQGGSGPGFGGSPQPGFGGQQGGPQAGGGGQQGGPQPGFGQQGGQGGVKPGERGSTISTTQSGNDLGATIDVTLEPNASYRMLKVFLQTIMMLNKGHAEMIGAKRRIHELAAALKAYAEEKKQFPQGAFPRQAGPERIGVPYPPDQRISWMVELLPRLARGEYVELYDAIDKTKSWRHPDNLQAAGALVAQFLDPESDEKAWWVPYPGLRRPVAATHFVGIAGVGLDAAEYPDGDPRAGIFGYDRVTRLEKLKRPENTIAILQVPYDFKTSWMAGGGSTVRGVAEEDSIQPFICDVWHGPKPPNFDGKTTGTYAIMANGDVRFIPEDIDNEVFKKLCTLNGGADIDNLDEIAPKVAPPPVELKTAPPPPVKLDPPVKGDKPKSDPPKEKPKGADADAKALSALRTNCAKCHTGGQAKGKPPVMIFTAENTLNPDAPKVRMAEAVAQGKMPPKRGGGQLSAEDKTAIQSWLNQK